MAKNLFGRRPKYVGRLGGIGPTGSYRVTSSAVQALTNNARTTQGGLGGKLDTRNAKTIAGMQRLANRGAQQAAHGVRNQGELAKKLFGSAMGGEVDQNLMSARALARSISKDSQATVKATKSINKAANKSTGIIEASGGEAVASVKAQLQDALKELEGTGSSEAALAKIDFLGQLLQHKWDVQADKRDAAQNEAYLRMQMRLSGDSAGGQAAASFGEASSYLQDALSQTTSVADPNNPGQTVEVPALDPNGAANLVNSLTVQYGLGPEAASALRQVAFQRQGVPTTLDSSDTQHIAQTAAFVGQQASSGQVGALNDQNILDALGIVPQSNGTVQVNGQTYPVEWALQALAYFKQNYSGALAPTGA